ncbi:unnamed protein product [Acanthoscelides obtectus]|uniref:DDE Tnp4 domain-containing protein n=1 Tax=Acanthoscelides obtectus TaxID=200917 RepID=A0A9P0P4N8_ACAOB|nr:unnamed protein product [Acanthoscelides obtectus]CAK1672700.1 Protein ALP1-like [Acanthoscelides obtectus]
MSTKSDDLFVIACGFFVIQSIKEKQKKRKPRYWVRPFLKERNKYGINEMINNLRKDDLGINGELRSSFKNFVRISSADSEYLIQLVGPKIFKQNTNYRDAISVTDRLAITLRFLATGDSFQSLMYLFKVSTTTISRIVPEVFEELCHFIQVPTVLNGWKKIANYYNNLWNFPMCLGSMDGKHIIIQSPKFSGSEYINYKGTFSIVLFAIVDANYNFIYVYIGCQGRISDGGVFKNSGFAKALDKSMLNFPQPTILPGRQKPVPYVLVADDAFPLSENILKPFAGIRIVGQGSGYLITVLVGQGEL